jgi:hypothetical protein
MFAKVEERSQSGSQALFRDDAEENFYLAEDLLAAFAIADFLFAAAFA